MTWPDGRRLPAIVAENRGPQCVLALPDGQRQIVPSSSLSPG